MLPRLLSVSVVISLLPVYTSKNYLSWDATAELGYCAQRHSASVLDDLLLQRQFPINQIVTDCKALPFPEIVAGIVVCGHTDGDFRQADRTKRFNHTAHQHRANAPTARVGVNRRVVDARPSSVVAGKNRANDSSSIVLGYETGVGIASWIGDVFGTRRRSTTPMPTPVLIRTRPDRTTRPSGIDRSKNGRDMPRKETNPPHRKEPKMTARHIDATDKTDGSHVVKILWNENDGERELTVRMPAAGTDATDRVDVDLLPVPEEDPATTMDDAVAALEGFLGNNKYIHIDGDDVRSVCAGA